MVKQLKCFQQFQVQKGMRTFWKQFQSLLKYLWPFRVQKGMGNSKPPKPLCGSQLNTVNHICYQMIPLFGVLQIEVEDMEWAEESAHRLGELFHVLSDAALAAAGQWVI